MSTKLQAELSLENEKGQDVVAYPFIEAEHVTLANGMNIETMLAQDVSMPTVTHENLSFKVGVGDQDVSSAIVDSSVAEMTIKGQTYQNILPEPSTHVLSNNEEMFKVNEGLDPIVEIVDGVSRSAVLKGQTLVNVLSYTKVGGNVPLVKNGNVIEVESTTENTWRSVDIDFTHLKPNTKYIVTWDSIAFSNPNFVPTSSLISVRLKTDNTQIAGWDSSRNYIIATVPSDTSDVKLRVHASQGTAMINKTTVKGLKVLEYQEGMENWDIPYFEGMASCRMPILKSIGKNLYDPNNGRPKNLNFFYNNEQKNELVSHSTMLSCSVPITKGKKYSLSFSGSVPLKIHKSGQFEEVKSGCTGKVSHHYTEQTITAQMNGYWVIMFCYTEDGVTDNWTQVARDWENELNLMIVEDDTPSSYEPFKSNTLSCQLAPLNQSMFEQGTFAEATPPNTRTYEQIKLDSNHLYDIRIRTKGTYKVAQGATYEVQLNDGYGIFICYCKNGLYSATINRWLDGTRFTFTVPNDCNEMFFAIRKTDNTTITPSDFSLIGLKIHQEIVLRSSSNEVKDTLNLNTGEYVRCVGEVVLDGNENWSLNATSEIRNQYVVIMNEVNAKNVPRQTVICDKLLSNTSENLNNTIWIYDRRTMVIHSSLATVNELKTWLNENPLTVQYELATPIVKTVELSSSGNWEKVVLDGSESGWTNSYSAWNNKVFCLNNSYLPNVIKPASIYDTSIMCDKLRAYTIQWLCEELGRTGVALHNWSNGYLQIAINGVDTVDKLKQYLSQNPVTVWYQTTTHQDSTQVKQPIFFKDGHIIQSSGADNSLIPTLDYQAKTSNSYVMDLMKANTRYTMKAKSASGTFTIDGTSYGAGTNGTFTTPSSMTNKFLVMSNNANEEVMILEGDVTSKTIPYFKGIKSAFENEDKIEVLSTGKNLFDVNLVYGAHTYGNVGQKPTHGTGYARVTNETGDYILVKPNTKYTFSIENNFSFAIAQLDKDGISLGDTGWLNNKSSWTITTQSTARYVGFNIRKLDDSDITSDEVYKAYPMFEESLSATIYEPYESNSTKFSLSCGVNKVSEPLTISTEFGRWAVDTGAPEATNETRRSIRAINIPENTSEICFYNNDVLRAVNFHALDENENYVEYIHSADGRVAIKDGYKKFKIHLGTNDSSNLSCRFTTINNKALRSLPNGVCDEIILDRKNNKAKIIQRVGKVTYDGADVWGTYTVHQNNVRIQTVISNCVRRDTASFIYAICDKLPSVIWNYSWLQNYNLVTVNHANIHLQLSDTTMTKQQMLSWLTQNPITVQYELAEPVVTEVDLSGFPYIYKDGHIFLNGEITPVTEITYSINQEHQIEANNQDLIRHEQDIDFLYKLIKQYVIVDFQSTYLSLRNQ